MPLIIDSREKQALRKYLWQKGIKYEVKALKTGDYLFHSEGNPSNRVLVERKHIGDLVSSYISGRLDKQLKRMSEEKFPILLVTGRIQDIRGKLPFTPDERLVEEVLARAVIVYGFHSVIWIVGGHSDPKHEGLLFLVNALKQLDLDNLNNIPERTIQKGDPSIDTIRVMFNVPVNVANNLLGKFGNLRNIINADNTELLKVKGIGITRINRIRGILDGI